MTSDRTAASTVTGRLPGSVAIGERIVGPGQPCYVIAEAGSNHNGQIDLAYDLIDAAAEAGCDAVKFQVFRPEELLVRSSATASYLENQLDGSLYELFSTTAMDREWPALLSDRCARRGIDFLATPFDVEAAHLLASPRVRSVAIKNASSELWHVDLIAEEARTGLPLLLSTGMADLSDVDDALHAARAAGATAVCLLHCTVCYPTGPEDVNLKAMQTLRERYGTPVGLSDHTTGWWAPVAAVALGANLVEKHFTISRSLPGPDHSFALEPDELAEMVRAIHSTEDALGDGEKRRRSSEEEIYALGRRNLVAARDLPAGATVAENDITVLRSPLGIAPRDKAAVVGRRLTTAVAAGDPLRWESLA